MDRDVCPDPANRFLCIGRPAYRQFFKNSYQIGLLVLLLVAMGTVVEEKVTGQLAIVLTKPVSRGKLILSQVRG